MNREILDDVRDYYDGRLAEHGATPRGVDWNSAESQHLRFAQLARVIDDDDASSTALDYGCGYGAMVDDLRGRGWQGTFTGFDVSPEMVEAARSLHPDDARARFVSEIDADEEFDYVFASGIFNVRLEHHVDEWSAYVDATLSEIDRRARRGWAVNMLTSYSDADRMRNDLYYADPCRYFDLCMRTFSRRVAILHDYGLYEFTLLVTR
jgi:SAM-dependent methyltransferase